MERQRLNNDVVLLAALIIAATPLLAIHKKGIWASGGSMGVGALIAIKGSSRLRCTLSDLFLAVSILVLVLLETFTTQNSTSRLLLDVAVVSVVIVYASTGLTFRMIAKDQHVARNNASNGGS
jgi:hypothetical protein